MHRGDLALDVDTKFCKNLPKKTQHGDLSLEVVFFKVRHPRCVSTTM